MALVDLNIDNHRLLLMLIIGCDEARLGYAIVCLSACLPAWFWRKSWRINL